MVVKKSEPAVNDIGLEEEIVEEGKDQVVQDKQNTEEQQPKPPPDMKLLLGLLQKQKPTGFETIKEETLEEEPSQIIQQEGERSFDANKVDF